MKESKWFIAYTRSRAEKKVFSKVQELKIESFLPLQPVYRKWSDRVKLIEVPLFPGYIFIKTIEEKLPFLMSINGIVTFLSFNKKFASINQDELDLVKKMVNHDGDIKVDNNTLIKGEKIIIRGGSLAGTEGILVDEQGKDRVIIEIKGIGQNLSVEVPKFYLAPKR